MNIPDKALEAAARAHSNGYDTYPELARRAIREEITRAVEAAAPYIAAQALRDIVQDFGIYNDVEIYPVELQYSEEAQAVRAHIRDRANEIKETK